MRIIKSNQSWLGYSYTHIKYEVVAEKVTQFLLAAGIDQPVRCKS